MIMKNQMIETLQKYGLGIALCSMTFVAVPQAIAQDDNNNAKEQVKRQVRRQAPKYPTVKVSGKIYDQATKQPLAGIQLQALGNNMYTAMTDENGAFTISVPTFTTSLYVHAPQFLSQQVAITAGKETQDVNIYMMSDKFGAMYTDQTEYTAKQGFTSTQTAVTIDGEIENKLGGSIRAITRSAAQDGGASMFIRGLNSLNANAQPLVVIDGVEQDMQLNRLSLHDGQFNNILANISPDDIDNVTVLKNATALYGARGANGVILIDTKRGHSMATRIDANISAGVSLIPSLPKMMNASQYRTYASEILGTMEDVTNKTGNNAISWNFLNDDPNGYYYKTYHNDTDWSDYIYRNALTQNYSVNVQGGDNVGMYNLSVGYLDAQSTAKENSFNRMNVRFNTDINISSKLKTKFDINITRTNNEVFDDGVPSDLSAGAITSPTFLSLIKSPLITPYEYNSVIGGFSSLLSGYDEIFSQLGTNYSLANPVAILKNASGDNKNKAENTYFNVRIAPVYKFNSDMALKAVVNYTLNRNAQRYYRPYNGVPSYEVSELGTVTSMTASMFSKETNLYGNLEFDWNHQFGAHTLGAFVGAKYNYFSFDDNNLSTEYTSETNDKNPTLSASSGYQKILGDNDVWKNLQWYANVDYNYMNRYFATVSLLAEANSRFGENADGLGLCGVKWAMFPSVQLGWVLTNESWFPKNSFVNYLRLNAGFDLSGNDDISNYAARTSFTTVKWNYRATGIQLTNIGNDNIKWETTSKVNIGLQAYMLQNRLGVNFDVFFNRTSDLLSLRTFNNPIGGINNYWTNGGSLSNKGFELGINGKPVVTKDWTVELGVNVGHYKNELLGVPGGDYTTSVYGDNNILTATGHPVGVFYGYKTQGVFSTTADAQAANLYIVDDAGNKTYFQAGDVHFVDKNGDGEINEDDKFIIGDPNPDLYGNIFANVSYKRLTLSLGFNYSIGNDVYNYQRSVLNSGSTLYNQQVATVGHWRYEGQVTDMPRVNYGDPLGNNRFSDRWIEDGSYLRLKTLNLSYKVPTPSKWSWLQGLTIWGEAQNLFTITKYLGSDPEFSIGNSVLYQGIDCGNIAQSRSFTFGVKINL